MTSTAVEPGGEDGDDLQHILYKLVLEGGLFRGVDDDDFGAEVLSQGEDQFRAEPQKAVLVRDHQAPNFTRADPLDQQTQALFVIVEPGAQVLQHLVGPTVRGAERLQERDLTHKGKVTRIDTPPLRGARARSFARS